MVKISSGDPEAFQALLRALQRGIDDEKKYGSLAAAAAQRLGEMGTSARLAAPKLTLALNRLNADYAVEAARALARVTAGTDEAVAPITHALEAGKSPQEMGQFLGGLGTLASPSAPTLRNLVASPDVKVAYAAYNALARISGARLMTDVEACGVLRDIDHAALPALKAIAGQPTPKERPGDSRPPLDEAQAAREAIALIQEHPAYGLR